MGTEHNRPILVMPPMQRRPSKLELWRNRLFLVEVVLVCLIIGIILIVTPWTPFWTHNSLLLGFPQIREFLMHNFVRGLISGLGLIDIWMAVSEVLHYRES